MFEKKEEVTAELPSEALVFSRTDVPVCLVRQNANPR